MGYESRFYVINKFGNPNDEGSCYAEAIAVFDMCKVWGISKHFTEPLINIDFYPIDDRSEDEGYLKEDLYGDTLKVLPIAKAIEVLKEKYDDKDYRRYQPFLCMLEGFDESQWDELLVVHFGY